MKSKCPHPPRTYSREQVMRIMDRYARMKAFRENLDLKEFVKRVKGISDKIYAETIYTPVVK